MQSSIRTAIVVGLSGEVVRIRADRHDSISGLSVAVSGLLPEREAVRIIDTLLRETGVVPLPACHVAVEGGEPANSAHLSPVQLAMALAVAEAHGALTVPASLGVVGALSPDGELLPVRGVGALLSALAAADVAEAIVPAANGPEASLVEGIVVRGAGSFGEVLAHLRGESALSTLVESRDSAMAGADAPTCDMADIRGYAKARRGLEIAAAGGHPAVLIGAPGSGRTMLARRVPTILPPMDADEAAEVTNIYSVAGLLPTGRGRITSRPFRAPHSTISYGGLLGGGRRPRPGELTTAHRGVLYLDEVNDIGKEMLEVVGRAAATGHLPISSHAITINWPTQVLVIGAMNRCGCEAMPMACECSGLALARSEARIQQVTEALGAFRIPVTHEDHKGDSREPSADIRGRVTRAQERRAARDVESAVAASTPLRGETLITAIARTIADLAGTEAVERMHVDEAREWVTGQVEDA